jgi:hypothetical protein
MLQLCSDDVWYLEIVVFAATKLNSPSFVDALGLHFLLPFELHG